MESEAVYRISAETGSREAAVDRISDESGSTFFNEAEAVYRISEETGSNFFNEAEAVYRISDETGSRVAVTIIVANLANLVGGAARPDT